MDDLISRKVLDDAFTELRWNEDGTLNHFGDRPDWCMHGSEVDKLIQTAPSAPAVPLDRLCEWLQENASLKSGTLISAVGWKYALIKWMEEEDAD